MKFLLGLGIGIFAGLVLAPAPGEQTRSRLARSAREAARVWEEKLDRKVNQAVEQVSETAREKAGEIGAAVGRQAAEAFASSMIGHPESRTA